LKLIAFINCGSIEQTLIKIVEQISDVLLLSEVFHQMFSKLFVW